MTATGAQVPAQSVVPAESNQPQSRAARWGSRIGVIALLGMAPAATVYLSFSNGGYFPNSVGIVAICFCGALVARVTLADRPFEGYNRAVGVAVLALALFALLQLVSLAWSHTPAPALDDYDRTFLYVLVLALFGSLPRSRLRLTWLTRSLAAAMSAVCLAGLLSRVLPHVWPTALGFYSDRLSYPLGYWNALGLLGALACILLLHFASSLREPWPIRVAAAALFPAVATTALLTYSRGALGVGILGLIVYAILGRPRGLLTGLIAIVPTSFLALHSAYNATLLSGPNPTSAAAVAQGHHVAVVVGLAMLGATVLRAGGLWLDRWLRRAHRRPSLLNPVPRWAVLASAALAVVLALVLAGAPGFISREFHRFTTNQGPSTSQLRDRLTDPASNGRIAEWKVGLQQFSHNILAGEGAGTYQTYWAQHRTANNTVTDTHSLYIQTLGEDGILGMIVLAVALLSILVVLLSQWRGRHRSLYAALFAAGVTWAVHGQFDWDWQMPAVTLWLFAVGGLALANRRATTSRVVSNLNRTALAAGLLVLAIAPLLIGFSYQRLRASGNAFVSGNCSVARQKALSSISLLAVRPQAYEILGYCDLQQSYPIEGLAAMRKAVSYDRQDWESHYSLAIALAANGFSPLAEARQALALNPRESLVQAELHVLRATGPRGWVEASRGLAIQALQSGALSISHL